MIVKCISTPKNSLLVLGRIYEVVEATKTRYLVNVFDNKSEYAPMYGSFDIAHFDTVSQNDDEGDK